jgi:hypothetical protein
MPFKKVIEALEELNEQFAPLLESAKPAKGKKKAKPADEDDEVEDEDDEEVPAAKSPKGKKKTKDADEDEEEESDDEEESSDDDEEEAEEEDEEEKPKKKKGAKGPTLDDVKAALRSAKADKKVGADGAKAIMKKAGKNTDIMKIKAENYQAVIDACEEAISGGEDEEDDE